MMGSALQKTVFVMVITLSLVASGCSVSRVPDVEPGVDFMLDYNLPLAWTAGEFDERSLETAWWTQFRDPELNQIVGEVLRQNYDLRVAVTRLEQAEGAARIAGADLFPTLSAGTSASRNRQVFVGFPDFSIPGVPGLGGGGDVLATESETYGVSLNTGWELDVWGRVRKGAQAALADYEASINDIQALRLSLSGQAAKLYYTLVALREQLETSRATVESFSKSRDWIFDRYREGLRSSVDLRLAEINLASAEATLAAQRTAYETTLRQLEALIGRYPDGSLTVARTLPDVGKTIPAGLPSELLLRRYDLQAAERRVAAASTRIEEARRALFPSLSLTGSYGRQSEEIGDLLDNQFRVWNIAANLAQPILQGGRIRENIRLQQVEREAAILEYAGSILNAFAEVEGTLAAEEYLAEQEVRITTVIEQSEAASQVAEESYQLGVGDYLSVYESQRTAFQAIQQAADIRLQRITNRIDLLLALGGGFGEPMRVEQVEMAPLGGILNENKTGDGVPLTPLNEPTRETFEQGDVPQGGAVPDDATSAGDTENTSDEEIAE